MANLNEVICGLECCLDVNGSKYKRCLTCNYRRDVDHCQWACQTDRILEDAIALLKAQEPVEPRISRGWYKCGACGNGIATILDNGEPSHKERYCNLCGRAVKWE